jgi:hypothetical protein
VSGSDRYDYAEWADAQIWSPSPTPADREAIARLKTYAEGLREYGWYPYQAARIERHLGLADDIDAILAMVGGNNSPARDQPCGDGTAVPLVIEGEETCIACGLVLAPGSLVLSDASGGTIHADCCGPERESYINADGEPLRAGDPIPTPWVWP